MARARRRIGSQSVRHARLIAEWLVFIILMWAVVFLTVALTLTFPFWCTFFYSRKENFTRLEAALRTIATDVESRWQEGHYNFQYSIIARTALSDAGEQSG